ncbi:MAG: hypothetical protein ABSG90_05770 [Dehalococcoidia bacterium]|jgi:hypothetical protein
MSLIEVVQLKKLQLIAGAIQTIDECIVEARRKSAKPGEVEYVATLVIEGTKKLGRNWSSILSAHGIDINITGIFCHQKPKIKFPGTSMHSIEIGDLLFCHFHTNKNNEEMRNAILYQAKMCGRQISKFGGNELKQFKLYSEWPEFKYVHPNLGKKTRQIIPSAPRRGAEYLLIDKKPLCIDPFHPCLPCLPLSPRRHLSYEMIELLEFLAGDPFDSQSASTNPSRNDWSTVIWDLLHISAVSKFTRFNAGYIARDRIIEFSSANSQTTPILLRLLGEDRARQLIERSGQRDVGDSNLTVNDTDRGVSCIILETRERPLD